MRHKDDAGQQRIDFSRAEQLGLLRRAVLPLTEIVESGKNRNVRSSTMMTVLRAIDDHGRKCWASLDTLASETGLSRRAVIRAVAGLVSLSVVCVEQMPKRGGGFNNEYTVVWNELQRLDPPKSTVPRGQATVPSGHPAQCPGGTQSGRGKRNRSERGRAREFPDFRPLDLANANDVLCAQQMLGPDWDFEYVAQRAAKAVRKAKGRSPHGLFVTMLATEDDHEMADVDKATAKWMLKEISGYEVRR